jgi:hypothetical protein
MAMRDVLMRAFEAVERRFGTALEDVTPEQLAFRPDAEANSIAWLAWHLTRWQDAQVARFSDVEQLWTGGWAEKFGRAADGSDTGLGHTSQQVGDFRASAELLQGYHQAVSARTLGYLREATDEELAREVVDQRMATTDAVYGRLVGVLSDNFQHVGQMAYLRGLMAGAHWGAH